MTVNKTAQDDTDTTVSDDVDTSTNEGTQDTDLEESFDDDTTFEDETNESEESDDDSAATDDSDETEEDSEEDGESDDSDKDEAGSKKDSKASEKDTNSDADVKRRNAEMAQRRIAEREAKEQLLSDAQQQYLQKAEDTRDLALRQLQVDAYKNRVDTNTTKLQIGIDKAVASIELFRNGSPEQVEALLEDIDEFEQNNVRYDELGNPIEVRGDVFSHLQKKADIYQRMAGVGARNETKAKNQARSRTDTIPSRSPKEAKKDELIDGFDEEANRW